MGKGKDLSSFERGMIVGARLAGASYKKTAIISGRSKSVVIRAVQDWVKKSKTTASREKCGRKQKIDSRGRRRLVRIVKKNRKSSISGLTISFNSGFTNKSSQKTVRRAIRSIGFRSRVASRKPFISKKNKSARLSWAKEHSSWKIDDWKNVVFSDESKFTLFGIDRRKRVWRMSSETLDQSCIQSTVQAKGGGILVWSQFCWEDLGELVVLRGTVNSEDYLKILRSQVLPFMNLHFPSGCGIFQDDNAPIHRSKAVKQWFLSNGPKFSHLKWPAQSPDLNPIEHLWNMLEIAIRKRYPHPSSLNELCDFLSEEWGKIDKDKAKNLVESMPHRIAAVIKSKGGPTKY